MAKCGNLIRQTGDDPLGPAVEPGRHSLHRRRHLSDPHELSVPLAVRSRHSRAWPCKENTGHRKSCRPCGNFPQPARSRAPITPLSPHRGRATVKVRGSPVLGRAQGWRCAPPPPAASALTPSAPRAGWHPCGRRRAPTALGRGRSCDTGGGRVPHLTPRQHRVEDDDQLAHAGDQGDFGFLPLGAQPLIDRLG